MFDDYVNDGTLKEEISAHPDRTVDNYFLDLTDKTENVLSAIIFAPIVYGRGAGPVNQRSIQIPELCRIAIERGRGVQVGKGLNRWGNVNVADLGALFVKLVHGALMGDTGQERWGEDGLYFASTGKEMVRPPCRVYLLVVRGS